MSSPPDWKARALRAEMDVARRLLSSAALDYAKAARSKVDYHEEWETLELAAQEYIDACTALEAVGE